ncbi:MAG: 50S ribosomal protein L11 methyltransferase [Alphaproteobacteria bacterium]|nr:50S ribosomal protein L11 methyltransferase [Alphaproteobacteria bacterium]
MRKECEKITEIAAARRRKSKLAYLTTASSLPSIARLRPERLCCPRTEPRRARSAPRPSRKAQPLRNHRIIDPPGGTLWRLSLLAPNETAAQAAAAALEPHAATVSLFEMAPGGAWHVEAFAERAPDRAALEGAGALAALALGAAGADLLRGIAIERVAARDWVGDNQQSFPPLRAGRFFIHGSHIGAPPPAGAISLRIDAATAFGTGEHASTRGCLLALDALAKRRRFSGVLDMGTGTGILAMAAARLWRGAVLACDIDPGAVAVARANASANRLVPLLRVERSNGYDHPAVRRAGPFALILANILARPLAAMAGELAAHLAPGGIAILSGLLARQAPLVLAAHRARGLRLVRRIAIAGWVTLVLERPAPVRRRGGPDRWN